AYTMSDIYIRRLDVCRREDEIDTLHETVVMDFTRKMKKIKKESILPKPVVEAMDYVYEHLHEKIRLEDIASAIGLNKTYLCGLFKKETQMTLGEYIMKRRLEAARNMLAYSDYSSIDICNYLCFSSHSHFINAFKKETGMTPKQFRDSSYRAHFSEHL
ncbi:MAG: AraC family transcriptional regulator, partial [Lachnospiraceae bacterium]|nr:AraC family transcriptional regulator [Lachnospiraceae bacterium]